ncbi:MAG: hypothetical protein M1497_00315 [Nitrospirae bacterium]|nr:hypothetical protein [Nitrospirota bacterium]
MSLRTLSEAIILQSAEDLLSVLHRKEGLDFFGGEGFRLCSEMAGMTFDEKMKFLHMLLGCIASGKKMTECSDELIKGEKAPGKQSHARRHGRGAVLNAM